MEYFLVTQEFRWTYFYNPWWSLNLPDQSRYILVSAVWNVAPITSVHSGGAECNGFYIVQSELHGQHSRPPCKYQNHQLPRTQHWAVRTSWKQLTSLNTANKLHIHKHARCCASITLSATYVLFLAVLTRGTVRVNMKVHTNIIHMKYIAITL
jgi:hypothetical protein